MADAWAEGGNDGTETPRWLERVPLPSLSLGFLTLGLLGLIYLASALATGFQDALIQPGARLGLSQQARYDLVMATLVAYTVGVSRFGRRRILLDLEQLRPRLRLSEPELEGLMGAAGRRGLRPHALSLLAGASFGIALELWVRGLSGDQLELNAFFSAWGFVLNVALFGLLGRMSHLSLKSARLLSRLGREHTEVRLLDPESRQVFARSGLRGAAFWFVGSSIASLLVLEAVAPWMVLFVIGLTLTLGIVALLLPARGIHHAVRKAKRAELAWVRRAVEEEREQLARPDGTPERAARLPALLAYEGRIEAVREWPFDSHLLLRFSLFLLLPLGSWVGGALVERVVDVLLG